MHPILLDFFSEEGDYKKLARNSNVIYTASGGNSIAWKIDGEYITLSHQYLELPECRIKIKKLMSLVNRHRQNEN